MKIAQINNYLLNIANNKSQTNRYNMPTFKPLAADSVTFSGNKANTIKIPIKKIETFLVEAFTDMDNAVTIEEKRLIVGKIDKEFTKTIIPNLKPGEERNRTERTLIVNLDHDIFNVIQDLTPEKLAQHGTKGTKLAYKQMMEILNNYQLMFDNDGFSNKSFSEIFDFVMKMSTSKAKNKQISINVKNQELLNSEFEIKGPNDYIFTVFHNLLGNSIKYTPEKGKIKIDFKLDKRVVLDHSSFFEEKGRRIYFPGVPRKKEQNGLILTIQDTGIGIPKSEIEKVLQGGRGKNAIDSGIPGTGFGLGKISRILRHLNTSDNNIKIKSPASNKESDSKFPGTKISCFIQYIK